MVVCAACGVENPEGQRFCGSCAAPLAGPAAVREQRKTVTAVFCDVVGSTSLGESQDPEAVRALLVRYFERMRRIVEAHGGTVAKFIGDAVVAVFGVPVVHEDDAARAVRAAVEMRAALPDLELQARIGVNTGEVVTSSDDTLVTGDAVNVAARLQQAAAPGEILIGEPTRALARDAISVEELEPLELKGKREPVAAYRLLEVHEAPEGRHGSSFVGREPELALLRDAWRRAAETGRCELVTIIGEPGVGKSRLVAELVQGLDARVVHGRCLSYGEGITYRPVVEVIRQLDTLPGDPSAAAAIRSLLGESGAGTSADQIGWAFRALLETVATESPLVVVLDDIQWGEDTFLDLIEHVSLLSGAPFLLLCIARPELSERRPQWPVALRLRPLARDDVEALLPDTVTADLRDRIVRAAGGNPLFVTEMIAVAADIGGDVTVPPTLKALLATRLDQLDAPERTVLEHGSIEGEVFHRGTVQALGATESPVTPRLTALVRKELIRPDRPQLPGDDGFRFCHLLIRDAAYEALPKAARAELHERFADWLAAHATGLVERDEIAGYHLEQAYGYRSELGHDDDRTRELAGRAAAHLTAAGRRAQAYGDLHAVANLLTRALSLGIVDQADRAQVQFELGRALYETGKVTESDLVLTEVLETATALGERGIAARAHVQREGQRMLVETGVKYIEVQKVAEEAMETFRQLGDPCGAALAGRVLGLAFGRQQKGGEARAALKQAVEDAEACGDPELRRRAIASYCGHQGGTPVPEATRLFEELLESTKGDRLVEAVVKRFLARYYAMACRYEEALELAHETQPVLEELNQRALSWVYRNSDIWLFAGDRISYEKEMLAYWRYFRSAEGNLAKPPLDLVGFYCDEGRWEEAAELLGSGRDESLLPTPGSTPHRSAVEARLAAHRGELTDALALAERAADAAEGLGNLDNRARIWLAVAEVRQAAGRTEASDAATARALELFEERGNIAAANELRARIASA
jgi:class 3 adenylate cyclase/tetratricopeptide (TPR) repeat protein